MLSAVPNCKCRPILLCLEDITDVNTFNHKGPLACVLIFDNWITDCTFRISAHSSFIQILFIHISWWIHGRGPASSADTLVAVITLSFTKWLHLDCDCDLISRSLKGFNKTYLSHSFRWLISGERETDRGHTGFLISKNIPSTIIWFASSCVFSAT